MKSGKNQSETFSISRRFKSFSFAFKGILFAFKTQHNLWIHFPAIILVVIAGFIFRISPVEWLFILCATGMVLVAELFNTAVESLVDFISAEYSEKAGIIKDLAAGAVLVAAVISVIIAIIIFLPKILY